MSTRTFIAPFASAIAALVLAGRVPGHPAAPVPVEAAPPSAQEASSSQTGFDRFTLSTSPCTGWLQ